jgi:hypothetical protein
MIHQSSGRQGFADPGPERNQRAEADARPMMRMIHSSSGREDFGVISPSAVPTVPPTSSTTSSSAPPPEPAFMLAPSSGRQGFSSPSSYSPSQPSLGFAMARPSSGRQDFSSLLPQPPNLANSGSLGFAMALPSSGRQDFSSLSPQTPNLANSGGGSAPADGRIRHESITCDVCGASPIVGVRYRCAVCPDYDVCELCVDHTPPNLTPVRPNAHDHRAHYYLRIRETSTKVSDCNTRPLRYTYKPALIYFIFS